MPEVRLRNSGMVLNGLTIGKMAANAPRKSSTNWITGGADAGSGIRLAALSCE